LATFSLLAILRCQIIPQATGKRKNSLAGIVETPNGENLIL